MFFEDEDKDPSKGMDDYDLDFEDNQAVSWDNLLEDGEQPQDTLDASVGVDNLLLEDDQSFDNLISGSPPNVGGNGYSTMSVDDESDFEVSNGDDDLEDVGVAQPYMEQETPVQQYEAPYIQTQAPDESMYQQTAPPTQQYQASAEQQYEDEQAYDDEYSQKGIPAGSFTNEGGSAPEKKDNSAMLGVLAAVVVIAVLIVVGVTVVPQFLPGANTTMGDANDLASVDQTEQVAPSDDSALDAPEEPDAMGPPADDAAANPTAATETAPVAATSVPNLPTEAGVKPGVSKVVDNKVAKKDEPGRGKVILPVVNTGRANPFTPVASVNNLGFMINPKMDIPEPPTEFGDLVQELDKLQEITVSGILYDSSKPSAIVRVGKVDYFVQKGDKIDGYIVADISRAAVVIKEGANAYRAEIGQTFAKNGPIKGQVSTGGSVQRQYVSPEDVNVSSRSSY